MEKVYINDLETSKRNEIIKLNKKLMDLLERDLYEYNMFLQGKEAREMFGADNHRYIDIRDNYSSFYLVLKDWRKFIENLDSQYLWTDEAIALYNKIKKYVEKLDSLDEDDTKYESLYDIIELECKDLLKECEEQLHTYEEYQGEDEAIRYTDEMEQLEEYYIEIRDDGTTDNVIKKDIAYTEAYI